MIGFNAEIVALDFQAKQIETLDVEQVRATMDQGLFVWLDFEVVDAEAARSSLTDLNLIDAAILDDALTGVPATRHARYEDCLHLVVTGCRLHGTKFDLERVDVVIGKQFLATIHQGPVLFLETMRKDYQPDFVRHAESPSFLIYELWDDLIGNYLAIQDALEEHVEQLQRDLIRAVDDRVFARVSELGSDLLHFRMVLLPARAVLTELASRKSIFISEATQPFLANLEGALEHVLQDLLVDRETLSDTLNLQMSMNMHRTNEVVKRLTVVSVIFLPLTFLCGVYGMNFAFFPETKWRFSYLFFWIVVLLITSVQVVVLRKKKLI